MLRFTYFVLFCISFRKVWMGFLVECFVIDKLDVDNNVHCVVTVSRRAALVRNHSAVFLDQLPCNCTPAALTGRPTGS